MALVLLAPVPVFLAIWDSTPGVVADMPVEGRMRKALAGFSPDAPVTAVALSMSTNQCALRGPGALDSGTVSVLPLYFPYSGFDDFVGLVPDIVRAHPDVVLIESGLLFRRYDLGDSIQLFRINLIQRFRALLQGEATVLARFVSIAGPCCPAGKPVTGPAEAASGTIPAAWTETREFARMQAGIEAFAKAGIKVVVLLPPMFEGRYDLASRRTAEAVTTLAARVPGADIRFLSPSEAYPETDFCDPLHVGAPGQARYSHWLDGQLAGLARPAR